MKIFIIGNVSSMMINFRKEFIIKLILSFKVLNAVPIILPETVKNALTFIANLERLSLIIPLKRGATPLDHTLNAKGLNPFKDFVATCDLVKLFRQYRPDVVFSFFVKPKPSENIL